MSLAEVNWTACCAEGAVIARTTVSKTTAVPMTFLHEGRQYIVFAIGAGANTSLVALTLPKPGAAGTGAAR